MYRSRHTKDCIGRADAILFCYEDHEDHEDHENSSIKYKFFVLFAVKNELS